MGSDKSSFARLISQYLEAVRANSDVPGVLTEASLYGPLETMFNRWLEEATSLRAPRIVAQARTRFGIPDFILDAGFALGYVEAKKPGLDLRVLKGRDKRQKESFLNLPNLIYTNYHDFELYEEGELVARASLGPAALLERASRLEPDEEAVQHLKSLLERFAAHRVAAPESPRQLATALARASRLLRDAVVAALADDPVSPLAALHEEWSALLRTDADDERFADAYAQTVAYGLLTARLEFDREFNVHRALEVLDAHHAFLGAALRLLTHPAAVADVQWAVRVVLAVVGDVGMDLFRRSRHRDDPLLYFYEDFLASYDPQLRDRRGVYYTPASVVQFQVQAVADLARELGRPRVLADDVVALDPATGTGTYPLALFEASIARVRELDGDGAEAAAAHRCAANLHGFELLVGPYTVSHQRLATRLRERGAPDAPVQIYLTDTLSEPEQPGTGQLRWSLFEQELAVERRAADAVKRGGKIMIVLGNPPYDRAKGRGERDWLQQKMQLFTDPVRQSARVNLKNLADPYVHFFRWGLWRLFEAEQEDTGPRILTYISNRSYLHGDAFEGLRLRLRERFDDLWIVDLEGDSRTATMSENVFDIRVGVAIIVALRRDASQRSDGTRVQYCRFTGSRAEKEDALKANLADLPWVEVTHGGGESFLPGPPSSWTRWPTLDQVMPLRRSGVQTKRDRLAVATTPQRLRDQVAPVLDANLPVAKRQELFHVTRDRHLPPPAEVDDRYIVPYGYRPFDVRWLYNDRGFIDFPRPILQQLWDDEQRAFVTLPKGHGNGPVIVQQTALPDLHAFRGSYGGHVFPLWLATGQREPNLAPRLLQKLRVHLGREVGPEQVFGYVFALLSAPSYQDRFVEELAQGFPRVPFTIDAQLFDGIAALGQRLMDVQAGLLTPSVARPRLVGEPGPLVERPEWRLDKLHVSDAARVEPVDEGTWGFSVSNYRVLERWIRDRAGQDLARDSDLVKGLLDLVATVSDTVAMHARLDGLLDEVLRGETFAGQGLLPIDGRSAASEFTRTPGARDEAAREVDARIGLAGEALADGYDV